jgi:GTPase SAR1 family protein
MIIGLFGPHAIGKTTMVERWVNKYPGLVGVHADNQTVRRSNKEPIREKGWQGSTTKKWEMLTAKRESSVIYVIEGCSSYGTQLVRGFLPEDTMVHVFCSPSRLKELLQARCLRKGRNFNASYWDRKRCEYESYQRMANCIRKHLNPRQYKEVLIERWEDWPKAERLFVSFFVWLHNKR